MEHKLELLEDCLQETEKFGVSFADTRIFSVLNEYIQLKNGQIDVANIFVEQGMNVRIIYNGAWGYAATSKVTKPEIVPLVKEAIGIAKASAQKLRKPVKLTEEPVIIDSYQTPHKIDPFNVDFKEKLELLRAADSILKADEQIKVSTSVFDAYRVKLAFASSEGSKINQTQTYVGSGVKATAAGAEVHLRSSVNYKMKGFEYAKEYNYEAEAERVAKEALILVNDAENCPKEKTSFILEPFQLGITIHESTGHPTELDRVLGFEADFAGTSFLTPDLRGNYRYGSDIVNLVIDPTIPYALGSFKYDDEGVEAKKFHIVKNGIFMNYMTDRETARELGYAHSFGNSRMANYNRIPIVRMGNLHLLPDSQGPKDIEEMIAETDHGVFGIGWKSHSIDDKRMNFQFSTEFGWLIENGEQTKPLKNVCYNALTPEFWQNCDMITQETQSYSDGPLCGKGVPMQAMWIEHGGGWARFQNTNVFAS
ncbi:MAG: TldD/PmbA family protein [Candidatus Hodarchaeota archaeon]